MPKLVAFFMEHWNMRRNFDIILHAYAVQLFVAAIQLLMSDLIFQEKMSLLPIYVTLLKCSLAGCSVFPHAFSK